MSHALANVRRPLWPLSTAVVGFVVGAIALMGIGDATPSVGERVVFTLVPAAIVVVAVAMLTGRQQPIAVAAMVIAVPPSVVVAAAAAEPAALIATGAAVTGIIVTTERFGRLDPGIRTLTSVSMLVVLASAWLMTTAERVESAPSWHTVVSRTGETARRSIVGVGVDGGSIALSALLVWLLGVGLLVGVALLSDRPWLAAVIPVALVLVIIGSWAVERWRGPVEAGSATWLISAAVMITAMSVPSGVPSSPEVGRAVWIAGSIALALGIVHHVRRADGSDVRLFGGPAAVIVAAVAVAWWLRTTTSDNDDVVDRRAEPPASVETMRNESDRP